MKKKDLDTFIRQKAEAENGIPFEESYWDDMNELLDTTLPVTQTPSVAKLGGKGLKYLLGASGAIVLVVASILIFSQDRNIERESERESGGRERGGIERERERERERIGNERGSERGAGTLVISGTDQIKNKQVQSQAKPMGSEQNHPDQATVADVGNGNSKAYTKKAHSDLAQADENLAELKQTKREVNGQRTLPAGFGANPEPGLQAFQNHEGNTEVKMENLYLAQSLTQENARASFSLINSKGAKLPLATMQDPHLNISGFTASKPRKANPLIEQINVSAFGGAYYQNKNKAEQNYNAPAQINLSYGIQVETTVKGICFKTGIGYTQNSFKISGEQTSKTYKIDTSYILVNPHFDTTLSGKPIALVQRKLDTTAVNTLVETKQNQYTSQLICIPTTLLYKIPIRRYTLILECGALHYLRVSQKSNAPVQVLNSEWHQTQPLYNLQLCGGLGLRYALNLNWAIGVNYLYSIDPKANPYPLQNNNHIGSFAITRYLR